MLGALESPDPRVRLVGLLIKKSAFTRLRQEEIVPFASSTSTALFTIPQAVIPKAGSPTTACCCTSIPLWGGDVKFQVSGLRINLSGLSLFYGALAVCQDLQYSLLRPS